ncbi:uncharacterized protein LOC122198540 isoform X3 [Panthera leo]|uniref:uncharacterized protein LOC122198540 isoform X3 n=1 Tax=Panthera leo TaxID=9689 RepID=UPI001C69809E|nr:uncharacterized protein LOC122198540 isoform X3 [Panthera leo]
MARKTEGISSYGAMKRLGIGDQPKADNKSRSLYSWKAARTSEHGIPWKRDNESPLPRVAAYEKEGVKGGSPTLKRNCLPLDMGK